MTARPFAIRTLMLALGALGFAAVAGQAADNKAEAPLRLNDIQALGSHNSYKLPIPMPVFDELNRWNPKLAVKLVYGHRPIDVQLDAGMRQLELDVYDDPAGGLFAAPLGERLMAATGKRTGFDPEAMKQPGLKVFHIQEFDYLSSCRTFRACLSIVRDWSTRHPRHVPLMITVNVKDSKIAYPGAAVPAKFGRAAMDRVDADIRAVFPAGSLITPDDVRGARATLEAAVLQDGWPLLEASRGKVFFVLDADGSGPAETYRIGHPALRGRAMFASYAPGQPEAAVMVINEAIRDRALIQERVRAGYIVRTRADVDSVDAVRKDRRRIDAARAAGAQYISTDYYRGAPDILRTGFVQAISADGDVICNKARARRCKSVAE